MNEPTSSQSWIPLAVTAMLLFIPVMIALPLVSNKCKVPALSLILYQQLGVATCIIVYTLFVAKLPLASIKPSWSLLCVLLVGICFAGLGNMSVFTASTRAPNSALPFAIVNIAALVAYLANTQIARYVAEHERSASFDLWHAFGIMLTIAGAVIVVVRK